jgi:hypothetical protein
LSFATIKEQNQTNLRDRQQAEENIKSALDLIESLENEKITQTIGKIRRILHELFNYFEMAKSVVNRLKSLSIDNEVLKMLCLAWQ